MLQRRKPCVIATTLMLLCSMVVLNVDVDSAGFTMDVDLGNVGASFWGEVGVDQSGRSVAMAGDVNGDGFDDLLIGAVYNDENGADSGQTYLIFGKPRGWSMDTNLSKADASFIGEMVYDYSGTAVAGVGDVNGDGFDDILIGAAGSDRGGSNAGQVYAARH